MSGPQPKRPADSGSWICLAEGVRFELTVRVNVQRFSRPSQSATLAPLRRDPVRIGLLTGADNNCAGAGSQAFRGHKKSRNPSRKRRNRLRDCRPCLSTGRPSARLPVREAACRTFQCRRSPSFRSSIWAGRCAEHPGAIRHPARQFVEPGRAQIDDRNDGLRRH